MADSISKRNEVKASTAKPSSKPRPRDKSLGIDPAIRFYLIKEGGNTEEGEKQISLSFTNKAQWQSKQDLWKPFEKGYSYIVI